MTSGADVVDQDEGDDEDDQEAVSGQVELRVAVTVWTTRSTVRVRVIVRAEVVSELWPSAAGSEPAVARTAAARWENRIRGWDRRVEAHGALSGWVCADEGWNAKGPTMTDWR